MQNKTMTLLTGLSGIALTVGWMYCLIQNLIVIFFTPFTGDEEGYYYDLTGRLEMKVDWDVMAIMIMLLFLLAFPWISCFCNLLLGREGNGPFGLFHADNRLRKTVSFGLSIINIGTIAFLTNITMNEVYRIRNLEYVCPNDGLIQLCPVNTAYFEKTMCLILFFWTVLYSTNRIFRYVFYVILFYLFLHYLILL